ncbi:MAG: DUF4926 domain-containing protein [Bacteroidia bacterium]
MLKEFERVFITEDLPGTPYVKGDVGVIAHVYENGKGYEIEFFAADGTTLSVETVSANQVKSCAGIKTVLHLSKAA